MTTKQNPGRPAMKIANTNVNVPGEKYLLVSEFGDVYIADMLPEHHNPHRHYQNSTREEKFWLVPTRQQRERIVRLLADGALTLDRMCALRDDGVLGGRHGGHSRLNARNQTN